MKICYLADARSSHTRRYVEHFAKEHEVDLITLRYTKKEGVIPEEAYKKMNVRIHKVSKKMPFLLFAPFKIRRRIKKIKPDIVHAHYVTQYGFCGAFSGVHPLVISAIGNDIAVDPVESKIFGFLVKCALKHADSVHVHDEFAKKRVIELGCDEKGIFARFSCCNVNLFSPEAKNEDLKRKLEIEDKYSVLCTRGCKSLYNVDIFIKAIPYVLKEMPNVKFIICGTGPLELEFKNLVKELGIDNDVAFPGLIPHHEMPQYLASVDLYVDTFYPPHALGGHAHGTGTMEAMSCGTSQVMPDRVEYSQSWFHGILYEKGNSKKLAEAIIYLLKNEKVRKEIEKKSRETVLKIGNEEKIMNDFLDIYQKLIDKKKRGMK